MNIVVYLTSALIGVHCIEQAIKMSLSTNMILIFSYLSFFGSVIGMALWVYFFGANLVLVLMMASMCAVLFANKEEYIAMISKNLKAFLDMLAYSEGTTRIKGNKDGYNVLVGGGLFTDMTNHPHKLITLNAKLKSSAAGRYQLLSKYYDIYANLLGLKDFSPASQDAIAIQQIKERKALPDIEAGHFDLAVWKCKNIWASLPGAGYGQHENNIDALRNVYVLAGGTLA